MKQLAIGAILVVLVPVLAVAQVPTTGLMVGPNAPILVDTNGDGQPDQGTDGRIIPTFDGQETLTVPNPWEECGPAVHNVVTLQDAAGPGGGPFVGGTRTTENQTETLIADQFVGGRPTHFTMSVDKPGFPDQVGSAGVVDGDSNGIYDALMGEGDGGVDFLLDLVFSDVNGDGWGDYVSIPWSQASVLGVATDDSCEVAGGDPQVWVPMADTNGDGRPDSIVFDLDGNGSPDPQFLFGPIIGPARAFATNPVPTLSQWSLILVALALASAAWMQIRSGGLSA